MLPSRYLSPKPALVKKQVGKIKHFTAPLKGLSLATKLSPSDAQTAPILKNFNIEDDRIQCRGGTVLAATHADGKSVSALIPWYGGAPKLLMATNHKLADALTGADVKTGFNGDDWSWTSFANLSQQKFTVMCNGVDGVWSWNGSLTADIIGPVAVTSLSAANPAVCTVAAPDISKFTSGQYVRIAGLTGLMVGINGLHIISLVGTPANTFTLPGVDTSTLGPAQTTATADPEQGIVKEPVTANASQPYIIPDQFQLVLSHMNRLWFADGTNLAVYYLPLQTKTGEVKALPLNALFKRGGSIRAMATWTLEGGTSTNDQLVIFSTNGECVIYQGTDPDTNFNLVGVFRFDAPMGKDCCINYGGDLFVLISTGVVPLSTMLRAEQDQLGVQDRSVISVFLPQSIKYRSRPGWQAMMNPSTGRLIVNMPEGASNLYRQMIRHMPRPVWSEWADVPSRCWAWVDPYLYFGDDSGHVYRMHPDYLNDAGKPIRCDVQLAWSLFGTPAIKQFTMMQPYFITDGDPRPYLEVKVDYDYSEPTNQPDISFAQPGADWDTATWDVDYWAAGEETAVHFWQGTAALGRVGGPRLVALVRDCRFAVSGFDVLYQPGALVG